MTSNTFAPLSLSLVAPVTLEGRHVRLEPLTLAHVEPLCAVGLDPELWRWTHALVRDADEMRDYVETALREQEERRSLPFAQVERGTGRVIGTSRFGNIDAANRRVEIGWTWIGRDWQRTAINTEAKYLLMRHAFERWQVNRVELKTDVLNEKSRRAIARIGAREEGILRRHMITKSGRLRDTVYFSVIAEEWPDVRRDLEEKLAR
jgi:N-acetyltransferase